MEHLSELEDDNKIIRSSSLPEGDKLSYEKLSIKYAWAELISLNAIISIILFGVIVASYFLGSLNWLIGQWWLYAGYLAPVVLLFFLKTLQAKRRGFSLREKDIHYKQGLLWRSTTSLPFNRIQHIEMESGPLERHFNLTSLKFFTAGGGFADLVIPALTPDKAKKMRAYIIAKAGEKEKLELSDTFEIHNGENHD